MRPDNASAATPSKDGPDDDLPFYSQGKATEDNHQEPAEIRNMLQTNLF